MGDEQLDDSKKKTFQEVIDELMERKQKEVQRQEVQRKQEVEPRLVVWRANKFELEVVPSKEVGHFFKGDCYLILSLGKNNTYIHYWLGEDSTQDEQGFVAIMAVEVDDYLSLKYRCAAIQCREVQGNESIVFKASFKNNYAIRDGGHESGFRKVSGQEKFEPHLYEVKGKVNPICRELPCKTSSLNSNDCYVLDGGKTYKAYVLRGKNSNTREANKAVIYSGKLCSGTATIIDERDLNKDPHHKKILQKLLGVSISREIQFASVDNTSDQEYEDKQVREIKLYRVRDDTFTEVPINQSSLDKDDCFVLKAASNVFVWKGSHASPEEKRRAQERANEFINNTGMPKHSKVVVVPQHSEPPEFTACFKDWKDKDETACSGVDFSNPVRKSSTAKSVHTVIDFRTLYHKDPPPAEVDPYGDDDGTGEVTIYHVQPERTENPTLPSSGIKELIKKNKEGFVFNSGDCYLIVYTYRTTNRKQTIIYYWIGNECDQREAGVAGLLASKFDEQRYQGTAIQERVLEGREPPHFMKIFGGYIMVKQGRFDNNTSRLFHVRGKRDNIKVIEVSVDAANLNTNDCFILTDGRKVYIWLGKGSLGDEQKFAKSAAADMYPGRETQIILESSTPAAFWSAIGGKKTYHTTGSSHQQQKESREREPRLFHMFKYGRGLEAEEIYDFIQDDLIENDSDVFVLDTYKRMYVWIGRNCRLDEKKETIKLLDDFIRADSTPRNPDEVAISTICQGSEPQAFKAYFGVWEDGRVFEMSLEEMKRLHIDSRLKDYDGVDEMICPGKTYSYQELRTDNKTMEEYPQDVLLDSREMFLSDSDFECVFHMTKEQFMKKKPWQREKLKKEKCLF